MYSIIIYMNTINNKYFSVNDIKIICQGALGAMTFGAYHQYTTNKIMEINNNYMRIENERKIELMKSEHNKQIEILSNEIKKLQDYNKKWFHFN